MNRLICLCGYKRSGKDYVADKFVKLLDYKKIAIAKKLKESLQVLFNFSDDQLHGMKKDEIDPKWNITPRRVMEYFGTEMMQHQIQHILPRINNSFWIQSCTPDITESLKKSNVVLSDLRFEHEIEYLKKSFPNVIIIRISNPHVSLSSNHISEMSCDTFKYDFVITNDPTKDDSLLHDQIASISIENSIKDCSNN